MSNPLLTYKVHVDPDPLQASPAEGDPSLANLTIVASNSTHRMIDCRSISFSFLVGGNAKDFFADATGIGTTAPEGWDITQSGGLFTATPDPKYGDVGADGLLFQLSGIKVNQQIGTTTLTVTESTSGQSGTQIIELAKFPPAFEVGDLTVSPLPPVNQGDSVIVTWTGSGGGAYELQYAGADGQIVLISHPEGEPDQPLPANGSYTVEDLEIDPTDFYLRVTMPVAGEDKPLVVERLFSVQVIIPDVEIKSFSAEGFLAAANSYVVYSDDFSLNVNVNLSWDVLGARRLLLNEDIVEGTSAIVPITAPARFTLHAYGTGGEDFYEILVTPKTRVVQITLPSPTVVRIGFEADPGTYTLDLVVTEVTGEADFATPMTIQVTSQGGFVTTDIDVPLQVMPPYGEIISVDLVINGFPDGPRIVHTTLSD